MAAEFNRGITLTGRCFEMKQVSDDTVLLRCAFFSRPKDKNDKSKGYISGVPVTVKVKVKGENCTEIAEMDYTNKAITVTGRFYVGESHSDKTGKDYTNLYIEATKVVENTFDKSNDTWNIGENLSGRCFEMKQISEDTVMLRCSFFSRLRDRNDKSKGYINGYPITVKVRVKGENCTQIAEQDYTNKPITVWGRFYATESHSDKTGKDYTNLYIDATKVEETVFQNSNSGGNSGNGGGWGSNG